MAMMYDQELIRSFLDEAKSVQDAGEKKDAADIKKLKTAAEKAASNAQIAFEQAQENRFRIDSLQKELRRAKIIAVIAIIIAVICMSMTMIEEINQLAELMP